MAISEWGTRLDMVERNIARNLELATENIALTQKAIDEMVKVADKFSVHVEYLTKDNERLRSESVEITHKFENMEKKLREVEIQLVRVLLKEKAQTPNTVSFDTQAANWVNSTFGKWILALGATAIGAYVVTMFNRHIGGTK